MKFDINAIHHKLDRIIELLELLTEPKSLEQAGQEWHDRVMRQHFNQHIE